MFINISLHYTLHVPYSYMKTDPQHLLPSPTPFYKQRWFWLIVITLYIIFATAIFLPTALSEHTQWGLFDMSLSITGISLFNYILIIILGTNYYLAYTIYIILLGFISYKIIWGNFKVIYPIIFLLLSLSSILLTYAFLTSFV